MRKTFFIIILSSFLGYSKTDTISNDVLKREALIALKNYNEQIEEVKASFIEDNESSIGVIVAATTILIATLALIATYETNKIARKANKIAKK